jgi:hypothetical protein
LKKVIYFLSTVIFLFVGLVLLSNESYASDINDLRVGEIIITDENGNVLDGIEAITESEDYLIPNQLLQRRVGHMVYRNVTVVKSNGLGIFPGSIYYSKQERGYTTPFTGTLYRQSAWSQSNGSWMVYYAKYTGTVAAYLG